MPEPAASPGVGDPPPTGSAESVRARHPSIDSLGILLPESWWTISLRDDVGRRRAVTQLIERQLGHADEHSALRADARAHLERTADDAARNGGRLMAVSLMTVAGVPVPATLTLYRLPGQDVTGQGITEIEAALRDDAPDAHLDLAEGPVGPVLRRTTTTTAPEELGGASVPMLLADYWLDPDDGQGLAYLVFSSPLVEAQDALLHLFDVIVGSIGPAEGER